MSSLPTPSPRPEPAGRAAALIAALQLQPHPEGGFYRELFRAAGAVDALDGRPQRAALTSIDFLLPRGHASAWHRVRSDEAWHLLEGAPLRLWLAPPDRAWFGAVVLAPVGAAVPAADVPAFGAGAPQGAAAAPGPRFVVPAHWWQAAESLGEFSYVGATVGPGFDFADFTFGRDDAPLVTALAARASALQRLL
jgi:predicted cupin superfamily sugar epimerase